ncbi:MAG TPA: helix-turn-helix domain-containing protein [Ohtaekwangia sp.]|nr:helix-turn-helix domain-containing protein [Ohtaekwangia sp.]
MTTAYTMCFEKRKASPALSHVVKEYTYREIKFHAPATIVREMPCRHISSMDFFLAGQYATVDVQSEASLPFDRSAIRGPRTHRKYRIAINEDFICFSIRFRPAGIFSLFGIPLEDFTDQSIDTSLVIPELSRSLTDGLLLCGSLDHCVSVAERILLKQLPRHNNASPHVSALADYIEASHAKTRIAELYDRIPLSGRHLERRFIKEVGISPKTYLNMLRFENVMQAKKNFPHEKWSSIAYDLHYFDQMHLVKDFKKFLGIRPSEFHPSEFALS